MSALMMELAEELRHRKVRAEVAWTPREANFHADVLANGNVTGFMADRRLTLDLAAPKWHILPQALTVGAELHATVSARAKRRRNWAAKQRPRKRPRRERLKAREPW